MTLDRPTTLPGDKLRQAVQEFAELCRHQPAKEKQRILSRLVIKYDLSPRECAYLERNLLESGVGGQD